MATKTAIYQPTRFDLRVYRGNDLVMPFTFTKGGEPPDDVGDWVLKSQVRKSVKETSVLAEFSVDATLAVAEGLFVLTIAAEDMALLPVGSFVWDLQRVAGGITTTLLAGSFVVAGDVTHA